MRSFYYWVGFGVIWGIVALASLVSCRIMASVIWRLFISRINTANHPWVLWIAYYVRRALGKYRYQPGQLRPPFLYNRSDMRLVTKEKMPVVRNLQANIVRYNRRRWLQK